METSRSITAGWLDSLPIFSFHRRILWVIGVVYFFEFSDLNSLAFVAPAILQQWHMSVSTLSLVISASFFGMFAGAMGGGRLSDLVGRKRALIATTVWFSVFSMLNAIVWEPIGLFIARLMTGVGLSAMAAVGMTYVVEMYPAAHRGRFHALILVVGLAGIPVTAYVARYCVPLAPWGWRLVFLWGSLGIFFPFFARELEESPRWLERRGRLAEASTVMTRILNRAALETGSFPVAPANSGLISASFANASRLFAPDVRPRTFIFTGLWMVQTLGFYGFTAWVPSLLLQQGISQADSLSWASAMQLGAVPGALLAAFISDRWQRKYSLAVVAVVIALFGVAYGLTLHREPIIVFGFLVTMFIQTFAALIYPYTAESFPTEVRSLGTGFSYGMGRLSNVFGPVVIALIFTNYGYRSVFIYIALCWLMVAAIATAFGPKTKGEHL